MNYYYDNDMNNTNRRGANQDSYSRKGKKRILTATAIMSLSILLLSLLSFSTMTTMTPVDNNHNKYQEQQRREQLIPEAWAGTFPGPNGQIAFVSDSDIFVMNATDGSEQTRLTDNDAIDANPSWSPDGTKIAFASDREEGGNSDIFVMNATDGSEQTNLSDNGDERSPDWGTNTSPVGSNGND